MNIRILLSCTAVLAAASIASAEQVGSFDPVTGVAETTRIPGSLELEEPRIVLPSFEPMPPPRGPCRTMVLTSTPVEAPVLSSFARMPAERHPVVACNAIVAPVQVAVLEPPRVIAAAEPPPYTEPMREPEPVVVPEELPHTGSSLPLAALLGFLSLGGAALVRVVRTRG